MTTATAPETTKTWWTFRKEIHATLLGQGMDGEQAEAFALSISEPLRRYAETIDALRKTYARIKTEAERALTQLDAGYRPWTNDHLGSDRDRLVTLHAEAAAFHDAMTNSHFQLAALQIEIDIYEYAKMA